MSSLRRVDAGMGTVPKGDKAEKRDKAKLVIVLTMSIHITVTASRPMAKSSTQ
jgi:hypothetical protein